MILENINGQAQTNAQNVHTVKIEANSTMFELLSSRLYSDKPMAVLRELSTNALDAQIVNGNPDKPFDVHLPTRLEPFLTIRDYGTGMSNDTVFELYGTMGASSKRNSNALNGALGVGSKSPFAYTAGSAFTVTSYFEGTSNVYSVFADNGIPSIAELGSFSTEEPNGVSVSVPVQINDIQKFISSAEKLYRHFKVKPEINQELNIQNTVPLFEGNNEHCAWRLTESGTNGVIIMANVAYPLDGSIANELRTIRNSGFEIEVPTGSIQFAASREALSYTEATLNKLKAIDKAIEVELLAQINVIIKKYENDLCTLSTSLSALPYSIRSILGSKHLSDNISYNMNIRCDDVKFMLKGYQNRFSGNTQITPSSLNKYGVIISDSMPKAREVALTENSIIIVNDGHIGDKEQTLAYLKEFADKLGVPYSLASEKHEKLFGKKQKLPKGVVATHERYSATGFKVTKDGSVYPTYHNQVEVSDKNKSKTIGIPVKLNGLTDVKYSNETSTLNPLEVVKEVLRIVKPKDDLYFVVIPVTHKKHLVNTIDIYTYLDSLNIKELEVMEPCNTVSISETVIKDSKCPKYLVEYFQLAKDVSAQANKTYHNRHLKQHLEKLGCKVKVKELKVPNRLIELHSVFKPLNSVYYRYNDWDDYLKIANALIKTELKEIKWK